MKSNWYVVFPLIIAVLAVSACAAPAPDLATQRLAWTYPTNNLDGTPITDMAGARVYYSITDEFSDEQSVIVPGTNFVGRTVTNQLTGLQRGKRYIFSVTVMNTNGLESSYGPTVTNTLPRKPRGVISLKDVGP